MPYDFMDHTADVKFRATGASLSEMYMSAAKALFEVIRGDIKILDQSSQEVEIEGDEKEVRLHNFLEEFLFLLDAKDFLVASIENLKIEDKKITFTARGDDADNYKFTNDVKAITYNEMKIGEENGEFFCEVTLDV